MKRSVTTLCLGLICIAGVPTDLFAESGKRAYIGLDAGGGRIYSSLVGYRIGGEIGFHILKRIGIIADFGYAYNTSYYYSDYNRFDYTYSSFPISGSLVYIAPVTQNFLTQIGIGLGYYSIKSRYERSYLIDEAVADSERKYNGISPHIRISIEAEVSNRIAIYAGIKHILGKAEREIESYYGTISEQLHFGGTEIKAGVKFYLW